MFELPGIPGACRKGMYWLSDNYEYLGEPDPHRGQSVI